MTKVLTLLAFIFVLIFSVSTTYVQSSTKFDGLSATVTKSEITCLGANDGIISVSNPIGGLPPYKVKLNAEGSWYDIPHDFTNLVPGTYDVYLMDSFEPPAVILYQTVEFIESANACTALEPVRISVTSPTPKPGGETLVIDLLQSDGSAFSPAVTINKGTVATDNGGALSSVLEGPSWGLPYGVTYDPNYLLRITYGGVVLSIERLEVVYSKQGLYGAYINPNLISQTQDFKFRKIGIIEKDPSNSQYYTYFQGGDQAGNLTYTLPTAAPTIDGQVLASTTSGTMSWTTPASGSVGLNAYGYCYELATIADATVVGGADIPFSNNGSLSSVTHFGGTTTITVASAGTYKLDYNLSITSGIGSQIAIAINGTVDGSTSRTNLVSTGQTSGTAILTLAAGDVITMRNNSATSFTMDLAPGIGAQITILKLD